MNDSKSKALSNTKKGKRLHVKDEGTSSQPKLVGVGLTKEGKIGHKFYGKIGK